MEVEINSKESLIDTYKQLNDFNTIKESEELYLSFVTVTSQEKHRCRILE